MTTIVDIDGIKAKFDSENRKWICENKSTELIINHNYQNKTEFSYIPYPSGNAVNILKKQFPNEKIKILEIDKKPSYKSGTIY